MGIEIETIMVGELERFARRSLAASQPGEVVPAAIARSRAQDRNPAADPGDVGLLVAYQDGRCVGYLGLMPGRLRVRGRDEKVYWLSTWYVPPELRHTGAGAKLLLRARALRRDLVVTHLNAEAARVYEALRFKPLGPLEYIEGKFSRNNPLALPFRVMRKLARRNNSIGLPSLDRIIVAADALFKRLLFPLLIAYVARGRTRFEARVVDRIGSDMFEADQDRSAPIRFRRGADIINWMIEEPWITTEPEGITGGFYFTDYKPLFRYVAIEIYGPESADHKGFVVLRHEQGLDGKRTLIVLDYHFGDSADERILLSFALGQARDFGADDMILPGVIRTDLVPLRLLGLFLRQRRRAYFCYTSRKDGPLAAAADGIHLSVSDGDFAFA